MATPAQNLYGRPNSALLRYARAIVLTVIILAACIWGVVALSGMLRDLTPEELRDEMAAAARAAPAESVDSAEQALAVLPLDRAIEQINRMPPEQRREVMRSEAATDYFNRLRPEQRRRFVEETLDRGLRDQLERYRKMSKEERKEFVKEARKRQQEAREELDKLPPDKKEQVRKSANSKDVGEMLEQASKAFLKVTTSEERAELQPLYDGALDNLQYARELK